MSEDGGPLVRADVIATAFFTAVAAGGLVAPDSLGVVATVVSLALFAIGCAMFLWAYGVAIGRSRTERIDLAGLFFLSGSAPAHVRRRLRLLLLVQTVVALGAAAIRPFTAAAFGVLVPVFGLGAMGAWAARHGTFAPKGADEA